MDNNNRKRNRFTVVEYSSYYAVRDNTTGEERPMSDGVDSVFTKSGKAISPGSEYFRKTWERYLNACPNDVAEAYFGQ